MILKVQLRRKDLYLSILFFLTNSLLRDDFSKEFFFFNDIADIIFINHLNLLIFISFHI